MTAFFTNTERALAHALAAAVITPGLRLPGGDAATVERLEATVQALGSGLARGYRALLLGLDAAARLRTGQGFAQLPLGRQVDLLDALSQSEATRLPVRGLVTPLKLAHFDSPRIYGALGCRYAVPPAATGERARWKEQLLDAADLPQGEALACDVVVVGTGAGGAPLAYELARRGHAVLLVEEGQHHTRADFTGRPVDMMRRLYRDGGGTLAFGNTAIPVPVGRGVGGTTLINSGTCFRAPRDVLAKWRADSGVAELTPEHLGPFYEQVEAMLGVAPSTAEALGPTARLIAKGCDALGYSHHALARNAPGCDGQGLCCFGCPTDAKRSTNVSYVPAALAAGAQAVTSLRVTGVRVEQGRAVGVDAVGPTGPVRIDARVVVLAAGALGTPQLLLTQGLANGSGQVGRHLSIHPATSALGVFDEVVRPFDTVPQGYAIDEFHDEGLLFEGASLPLQVAAAVTPGHGPAYTALLEQAQHTVSFGFLVRDGSHGRVQVTPKGELSLRYWLARGDLAKLRRGLGLLARVYFAAGAKEVLLPVARWERVTSLAQVADFERASLAARDVDLTAYHPLGTCRMGMDARRSVVGPTHESHEVPGLFIVDGSSLPGSPGVNPQVTIMALSLRAAGFVERALA